MRMTTTISLMMVMSTTNIMDNSEMTTMTMIEMNVDNNHDDDDDGDNNDDQEENYQVHT